MSPTSRLAAGCLAVALAAGLTGCRQRVADRVPPSVGIPSVTAPAGADQTAADPAGADQTSGVPAATAPQAAAPSGAGPVSQQDLADLQGILSSVDGAVTSARSAIAGDASAPQG